MSKKNKRKSSSSSIADYQNNFHEMLLQNIEDDCSAKNSKNYYMTITNQCNLDPEPSFSITNNGIACCNFQDVNNNNDEINYDNNNNHNEMSSFLLLINQYLNVTMAIIELFSWVTRHEQKTNPHELNIKYYLKFFGGLHHLQKSYQKWETKEEILKREIQNSFHDVESKILTDQKRSSSRSRSWHSDSRFITHLVNFAENLKQQSEKLVSDEITKKVEINKSLELTSDVIKITKLLDYYEYYNLLIEKTISLTESLSLISHILYLLHDLLFPSVI
jgi:hypothetical protein